MEDSYTVHRRRKAAAKKREKTPDPSVRNQQMVETSDGEEEARRAKMEQMAEDAERAELDERERERKQEVQQIVEKKTRPLLNAAEKKAGSAKEENEKLKISVGQKESDVSKKEDEARSLELRTSPVKKSLTRENDGERETVISAIREERMDDGSSAQKASESVKVLEKVYQKAIPRTKDTDGETGLPSEPRKIERRLKKRSKERAERRGHSSDSSDAEELERHQRRTKSPDGTKLRVKKLNSKKTDAGECEVTKKFIERPPREKWSSSKQKTEDTGVEAKPETGGFVSPSRSNDRNEDPKVKKSESFPGEMKEEVVMKRSSSDIKKQIIPLSNETLIQDFARAQREYLNREQSILDPDDSELYENHQEESVLRRRKFSILLTESEQEVSEGLIEELESTKAEEKKSWFSWLLFWRNREKKIAEKSQEAEQSIVPEETEIVFQQVQSDEPESVTLLGFLRALKDVASEFKAFVTQNPKEAQIIRSLRNRCLSELLLIIIYCGLGAFVFRFTEGAFETFYKCGVKRVKRDFLDTLWNYSHNMKEDDWKSMARRKLMEFEEQLHTAHDAGVHTYSGQRSWTFLNAVVYCLTVITTIGEETRG